jgi:serine/threonine protein kinase
MNFLCAWVVLLPYAECSHRKWTPSLASINERFPIYLSHKEPRGLHPQVPKYATTLMIMNDLRRQIENEGYDGGVDQELTGEQVLLKSTSSVFVAKQSTKDHLRYIEKITDDCVSRIRGRSPEDSPLIEYITMRTINNLGASPRVFSLSERYQVEDRTKSSEFFTRNFDACRSIESTARSIVMDLVGDSIHEYFDWLRLEPANEYFGAVLRFGIESIKLLRKLHSVGIVHGGFHGGSLAFKESKSDMSLYDWEKDDLVLVDFSLSKFFPDQAACNQQPFDRLSRPLLSPWQLEGQRLGRRDDVFRVIDFISRYLGEGGIDDAANHQIQPKRENEREVYLEIKKRRNLFKRDPWLGTECCQDMDVSNVDAIRSILEDLVTSCRQQMDISPDVEIDYDGIISVLKEVILISKQ